MDNDKLGRFLRHSVVTNKYNLFFYLMVSQ